MIHRWNEQRKNINDTRFWYFFWNRKAIMKNYETNHKGIVLSWRQWSFSNSFYLHLVYFEECSKDFTIQVKHILSRIFRIFCLNWDSFKKNECSLIFSKRENHQQKKSIENQYCPKLVIPTLLYIEMRPLVLVFTLIFQKMEEARLKRLCSDSICWQLYLVVLLMHVAYVNANKTSMQIHSHAHHERIIWIKCSLQHNNVPYMAYTCDIMCSRSDIAKNIDFYVFLDPVY